MDSASVGYDMRKIHEPGGSHLAWRHRRRFDRASQKSVIYVYRRSVASMLGMFLCYTWCSYLIVFAVVYDVEADLCSSLV